MMGFPAFQSGIVFPANLLVNFVFGLRYAMNAIYGIFSWIRQREGVPESSLSQESSEIPSHICLIAAGIMRAHSPVKTFRSFAETFGHGMEEDIVCAFCLSSLEEDDEVRELCNCSHVFHRNCLDKWVDHHHMTCPLCRCCLLPGRERVSDDQLQVVEQLSYLFGEDFMNS